MSVRVRHDDVRAPEGAPVGKVYDACSGRAAPEPPAVVDERVVERDERVEDDGPPAGDALRCREVEVARIADDQRVGRALGFARAPQAPLRLGDPQDLPRADGPVVAALPDRPMLLPHLDAGAPEGGDHLRVARVGAVVGAEVEDAH